MSFTIVIPSRMASTRLPNKPLADLGGKPMVVRVAEQAMRSGAARVVVATDHVDVVTACQKHGVTVCMTRTDHVSGTDRIEEVATTLNLSDDEVVVNVQGDEPLIDPELIFMTAKQIENEVSMATAAYPIKEATELFDPNVVKVVLDKSGRALYFSRAPIPWNRDRFGVADQDFRPDGIALRHVGIYAYRRVFLRAFSNLPISPLERLESLEQLRALWHGFSISVYVTKNSPGLGVDTLEDLLRAQHYFQNELNR